MIAVLAIVVQRYSLRRQCGIIQSGADIFGRILGKAEKTEKLIFRRSSRGEIASDIAYQNTGAGGDQVAPMRPDYVVQDFCGFAEIFVAVESETAWQGN